MKRLDLIILGLICLQGVFCDETATNATAAPPSTTAKPAIIPTDVICRACNCKEARVDCEGQDVKTFFTKEDWAGLKYTDLFEVDLSNNPLSIVTSITTLPIETLNLSRCGIDVIEKASFKELQKLRVLDLSHNKLTTERLMPHVFEGRYQPELYEPLAAMRELNLGYNDLHTLNPDIFEHLPELTHLDLSGNPFSILDHGTLVAISSIPMLKVLRMRSCQLLDIPDKFLHTPRYLEHLDLSDNSLTAVPPELEETKNLLFLNINQNPIVMLVKDSEEYPGFPSLPKLKELHMCNMDKLISIGEGTLSGLESIEKLHISFNRKLAFIDPKALAKVDDIGESFTWPMVKELYLQSNNITEIDRSFLSRWEKLTAVDLRGNPYMCDCSTQWMVDILVPIVDAVNPDMAAEMQCHEPVEMAHFNMQHLFKTHRTMRCVDKYGHRPERDGAILLGTLIGVLLAVPIMLSIMLLWRRGYFSCCGLRGPADYSRAFYKRAQSDDFNY